MREKPDSGKESKDQPKGPKGPEEPGEKRRLDLSLPQVAGSAIAAVVAAKLASNLGVYGTILGAGVVSAIATCGGTVFQHFFKRTGEQIRDVTVQAKPRARQVPVPAAPPVPETFRSPAYTGAMRATGPVTTSWGRPQQPAEAAAETDAEATTLLPTAEGADPTTVLPAAGTDPTTVPPAPGDDDATTMLPSVAPGADTERTQLLGAVDATRAVPRDDATRVLRTTGPGATGPGAMDPAPTTAFAPPPLPPEEFTAGTTHRSQVRSWKRPLIAAAVVFGVSMAGITTYEVVSGTNLSGGEGTSIGNGFSGHNSSPRKPSTPSDDEPAGEPSGNGTPSTGDGSQKGDGNATQDPDGTGQTPGSGNGNGTGSQDDPDKGTGSDTDKDNGSDSGDDGSKTDPTPTPTPTPPTPTPTPSHGGGSGAGDDAKDGGTPTP
ncbi:hypothetical protein ACFYO9_20920 [Streptomyces sp. NPDC005863]|uniref:hypothetical protein n=1 Tax=unclassified Streptomyces TaxID=2593676 RepID=UPI0033C104E9